MTSLPPLPIDAEIPEILRELDRHGACVLTSPPGSGKTTRVPGAVLDHGLEGEIWVLQPRRLAARAAARRVAAERRVPLGGEVGYQVRHDRRVGAATRIRFVTEGILARRLVDDPFLPGVGAVVLDEFHERSLEADLCLAMLAEVRETVREDLKLLVMSATLEAAPVVSFLQPCGTVSAAGRTHEVRVEYAPGRGDLSATVRAAVVRALGETVGDVLVFLPGLREIGACVAALGDVARNRDLAVRPLHGQLSAEEQDAAIVPETRRKVVLSTNVAETSITIEGVGAVVDSGTARVLRHDSGRGLDRLELQHISRASAEQRRGRAGRTGPGVCYRLWSVAAERGMAPFDTPEVLRADLTGPVLQVRAFAGRDPAEFKWFEAPEPAALARADRLLSMLGAVAGDKLTAMGRSMLRHPLHPRLARMMEEGRRRGCQRSAAEFAALLSEREIQRRDVAAADLLALRDLLHEIEDAGFAGGVGRRLAVDVRAARAVARTRDQIARGARDEDEVSVADLIKTLLSGFPDRVCRRESEQTSTGVMATGRGFRLVATDHENLGVLFLALAVRESADRKHTRALVQLGCPLEEPWLHDVFPDAVREEEVVEFVRDRGGAVAARRRRVFGELVLSERSGGQPDPVLAEQLLAAELRRDPWRYLGEQKALREFVGRLAWLRTQLPEAGLPEVGDDQIVDAAASLCAGLQRLTDLERLPVLEVLVQSLPGDVRQRVPRDAPERVLLPSGRRARIDYTSGAEPFVAARLQEFFGLAQTPRLAAGRVPLLLHLLAPNHRPVQITRDLASFWENVYPGVRSDLRRRYPKHAWPEDPMSATPESRPSRRR